MDLAPVESSTLATVGYDHNGEVLQLEFRSRAVYQYFAVPVAVYQALLAAASKGGYFNRAIRGRYHFVLVGGLPPAGGATDAVSRGTPRGAAWHAH